MADNLPEVDFSQPTEDIRKQFEKALADIRAILQTFLLSDSTRADLLQAEKDIISVLSDTDKYIEEQASSHVSTVVTAALVASLLAMGRTKPKLDAIKFTRREKALVDYAVDSLITDMHAVTANLQRQARTALRKAYMDELKRTSERSKRGLSREVKRMLDEADVAIIDKAGRRWKTSHYVETVTNTRLMEAYRETSAIVALEKGVGHAYVSYNPKTTDACVKHQYKIVKVAPDIDSPYPYYRDLDHIWHPSCRHHLITFSGFENLPARVKGANGL